MNVLHLFLFFLVISLNKGIAQVDEILIDKNTEDIRLQIEALDHSKVEEIISLSNLLYKRAFDTNDAQNMIEALQHLSTANLNSGNNQLAIEYLDNASSIAEKEELRDQNIFIINLKGNHYFDIEEYDKASSAYSEALSKAEKIKNQSYISIIKTNLAFIKLRTGDYRTALTELKNSEKELLMYAHKSTEKRVHTGLMLFNARISEAYIKLNLLDSALYANDRGLKFTKKTKIDNIHIDLLLHRGIIYKNKKKYTKALTFLNQAKSLCYKANDIVFLGKILNLIGECKLNQEEYEGSIKVLSESLEILTNKYSNSDELSRCYKLLGQAHKKNGDLENSNYYYEQHILSLSKLNSKKSSASKKIRDITMADYQSEIDILENQKKKQKNRLTYSQIGLSLFGISLVIIVFFFQKAKKKNKKKFDILLTKIEKQENIHTKITPAQKQPLTDIKNKKSESQSSELYISDQLYEQILQGLQKIESQEYYLKTECNLYNVAKKIATNTSYLSKVINSHFGKNFNTYINDLRIAYAIVRLKNDSKFRSYSIKSIAEEVGYKSADSFSKYFKIHTGLLPSFYIKELKSKH